MVGADRCSASTARKSPRDIIANITRRAGLLA